MDLLGVDRAGTDGAVWSLPRGADLNANLVHLAPGGAIGAHVEREVDVVLVGVAGAGSVVLDGEDHALRAGTLIAIAKGSSRAISAAADDELLYLSVHRAMPGPVIRR
jgi:quercetin dioxygenase-like cupin family protein